MAVSGERNTARQCRGYGPCPSRTAAGDTNADLKAAAASLPFGNQNSAPQFFNAAVISRNCTSVHEHVRGFHIIILITQGLQGLPQRHELRVQSDRRRQAVWAVPVRAVQPEVHSSTSVGAVRRIMNDMRNPSDIFLTCMSDCMGLDGSTCSECLRVVTCQFLRL